MLEPPGPALLPRLLLLLLLLLLAAAHLPAAGKKLRWCTLSGQEQRKCSELSKALLSAGGTPARVSCIRAPNTLGCLGKIQENKADVISLDAGDVYSAVMLHGLTVVAKEIYSEGSCVFAVAVARRGTLDLHRLKGVRSCHNGARWTSGWNIPVGILLARNDLAWASGQPLSQAVSHYFNASCIPGIGVAYPELCALCQGQKSYIWERNHFCETSQSEPFYGSQGAFRCLKLGEADVAFVDHLAVMDATESEQEAYELLCPNGSTAPLTAYATCHLGRGPGRAVVTRPNFQEITRDFLSIIQHLFGRKGKQKGRFELFASFSGKDLLFHDATQHLQWVGKEAEIGHVLGLDYVALLQGLGHEGSTLSSRLIRWCCISDQELRKCEEWALSVRSDPLVCVQADSMTHCIQLIKRNTADAVTLDATHAYFAEACALVPVAAECYGEDCASQREGLEKGTLFAGLPPLYLVALARKASRQVSRYALQGKRSCHSHVYSPGGWLLLSQHTVGAPEMGPKSPCNLSSAYEDFFWKGCMPGAGGNLCKVCIGGEEGASRCAANHNERYYGNLGALRCLLGDPTGRSFGDVAFLEHHNLLQNMEYLGGSGWAAGYGPRDLELLCPNGSRAALTAWKACNLGHIPPNIVVTRPTTSMKVRNFLAKSQESADHSQFQLFQSLQYGGSDLLFKDATRRLFFTSQLDFKSILGASFVQLAQSVFNCTPAGILDFCRQDSCASSRQP